MREPLKIKTPPTPEQQKLLDLLARQYRLLDEFQQALDLANVRVAALIAHIEAAEAKRT